MIHTSTPLQTISSGYSEGGSIAWSLRGKNWFANFGGGGPLLPPFGPVDPRWRAEWSGSDSVEVASREALVSSLDKAVVSRLSARHPR